MFRRLMIGNRGRARPMHGEVPDNPARGEAQGRTRLFGQTCAEEADRRRESKPRSRSHPIPGRSLFADRVTQQAIGHPDENQSGRMRRHERHVGPDRQKCRRAARSDNGLLRQRASCGSKRDESTRAAGSNLRRARKNPRSAVGRRRKREGKTCVVRPGSAMPVTGSGTPREEGAIWRMTRCGRRSLSEGARVAWVARERDDTPVNRRRPVCRLARCRARLLRDTEPGGSVSPISPARAIEDVAVGATDRLPADTDATELIGLTRRASDGFDWNAPGRHASATRASSQGIRSSGKPQGRERNHPGRQVALNRRRAGRRDAGWKRRSGIVRRLAAPDSASAASERCRGLETSREALDQQPGRRCGSTQSCDRDTGGRAGRAKRMSGSRS